MNDCTWDFPLQRMIDPGNFPWWTTEPEIFPWRTTDPGNFPWWTIEPEIFPWRTTDPGNFPWWTTEPEIFLEGRLILRIFPRRTAEHEISPLSQRMIDPDSGSTSPLYEQGVNHSDPNNYWLLLTLSEIQQCSWRACWNGYRHRKWTQWGSRPVGGP